MIYLDHNATTPMKPAVRAAMLEAMERHGNPSSVHRFGRIARRHVEQARGDVAALAGVTPAQVVFTSGGTEANALATRQAGTAPFIASTVEHESVLAGAIKSPRLPVTEQGVVDLAAAKKILGDTPPGALVSVMLVNNETGVIQPVAELAKITQHYGHRLHTDAVQAAGKLPLDFNDLGVDCMTLSAHKIGGPQGIGALIVAPNLPVAALLAGGGQEMNRRAGTENVPGIVGFGVAARLAADDLLAMPHRAVLRDRLQARLLALTGADASVLGAMAPRVANTLCLALIGVPSATQVMALDLNGIAASAGAACSSGKVRASHVARAMGCAEAVAGSVLRLSLGWDTKESDIDRCVEAYEKLYRRTRRHADRQAA